MNTLNKAELINEFKDTKQALYDTLDDQLGNIETTKEELQELREHLEEKGIEDYLIEKELKFYHIRKKLGVVLSDMASHEQLDQAISFLEDMLNK